MPDKLDDPLHWKNSRRIFVNSMSDFFHEGVSDEYIIRVANVMMSELAHIPNTHKACRADA